MNKVGLKKDKKWLRKKCQKTSVEIWKVGSVENLVWFNSSTKKLQTILKNILGWPKDLENIDWLYSLDLENQSGKN